MIRKDAIYLAIIILLLGFVVVMTCSGSEPYDEEKEQYEDSVKVLKADKAIISAQIERVIETSNYKAKVSDSLLTLKEREISRLKVKASQAVKNIPVKVIEENPEIMIAIEAKDSVINELTVLTDTLKNQLQFERNVREQLVALHYDSDKISASLQELSERRIVTLEKDLRKERRKGRFLKAVAIVGSVAAFIGGSQL